MKNLNILVVDDEEVDRKNLIRTLEQTNLKATVTESVDTLDAYQKMQDAEFDCVIMDYWMPGENGIDGLKKIAEKHPFTPVVMLTVESGLPTIVRALKSGAVDYISKDQANRDSLQRSIENAVEKAEIRKESENNRQDLIRFADVMVHDMKSPIGHMINYVDFLAGDVKRERYERLEELSAGFQNSADKLIELMDTLTTYTRSAKPIELEPVNLNTVLTQVLAVLDDVIREKGAKIEVGELHEVLGNAHFISQLLQNLIANALKFTDKTTPTVKVESVVDNGIVKLKVSDDGIGIKPSDCEKIFHPFSRLHGKNDYPGTGLGLATCERIVDRHGGRIWCESVEGQGATFISEFQAANS